MCVCVCVCACVCSLHVACHGLPKIGAMGWPPAPIVSYVIATE